MLGAPCARPARPSPVSRVLNPVLSLFSAPCTGTGSRGQTPGRTRPPSGSRARASRPAGPGEGDGECDGGGGRPAGSARRAAPPAYRRQIGGAADRPRPPTPHIPPPATAPATSAAGSREPPLRSVISAFGAGATADRSGTAGDEDEGFGVPRDASTSRRSASISSSAMPPSSHCSIKSASIRKADLLSVA